jgi:aspartyl/asparaginyl beta-hydroxylase (cupin superfamily)
VRRPLHQVKTRRASRTGFHIGNPLKYLWPLFWLNAFFDRYTGGSRRPALFDIDATAPALNLITQQILIIREELDALLASRPSIPRYHELDFLQFSISGKVDEDKDWRIFMLYMMGERPTANRSLCPKTCAMLDQVPDLFQAFFSILDAGKSIPPHVAPYRGYLRYHLGLKVPKANPPALHIAGQKHVWQEGKAILFDETFRHEVVNKAEETRVILVIDVLRPMPPLAHCINRMIAYGAARYVYAKGVLGVSALLCKFRQNLSRPFARTNRS